MVGGICCNLQKKIAKRCKCTENRLNNGKKCPKTEKKILRTGVICAVSRLTRNTYIYLLGLNVECTVVMYYLCFKNP